MATTIAVKDGKLTVTMAYAAPTAVMTPVLNSIAQGLYEMRGAWVTETPPETYDELTQAQKLKLIDAYVRWHLVEVHRQRLLRVAQADYEAAVQAAIEEGTVTIE